MKNKGLVTINHEEERAPKRKGWQVKLKPYKKGPPPPPPPESFGLVLTNENENMNKVGLWCERNKIALNVKKSKHMIVGPRSMKNINVFDVVCNGSRLGHVDCYSYLGIKIDRHLKNRWMLL